MDQVQSGFWISILVGGILIAFLSASQQYYSKKANEPFQYRPVIRDFCIGAFLAAIIYMFVPDSIQSMLNNLPSLSLPSLPSLSKMTGGSSEPVAASTSPSMEVEIQTGPAKF